MAKTPSPLRTKRPPKTVSKPAETAEAAATLAGSAPAPAAKVAAKKAGPVAKAVPAPVVAEPLAAKPAKIHKPAHKPKLVRDSFTIPKDEYQVLESLKARALDLGQHARKSELLRAGIRALSTMNDRAFLKAIGAVPTLKTGRPKAD